MSTRLPTIYVPHGGGPWPFMETRGMNYDRMRSYFENLGSVLSAPPSALLIISAHWEENEATVVTSPRPPLLFDYTGFPASTYALEWPAPGAPELAAEIRDLLGAANLGVGQDPARGFDHGTFVPTLLAYPEANVPTLQLSLKRGLNAAEHLAIGQALAPLRSKGVFIIGSGMSYHNMRGFFGQVPTVRDDSRAFDEWMVESCAMSSDRRMARLAEWTRAPRARLCHPREEHLLPLMVIAGAALEDEASFPYRELLGAAHVSAVHFG